MKIITVVLSFFGLSSPLSPPFSSSSEQQGGDASVSDSGSGNGNESASQYQEGVEQKLE